MHQGPGLGTQHVQMGAVGCQRQRADIIHAQHTITAILIAGQLRQSAIVATAAVGLARKCHHGAAAAQHVKLGSVRAQTQIPRGFNAIDPSDAGLDRGHELQTTIVRSPNLVLAAKNRHGIGETTRHINMGTIRTQGHGLGSAHAGYAQQSTLMLLDELQAPLLLASVEDGNGPIHRADGVQVFPVRTHGQVDHAGQAADPRHATAHHPQIAQADTGSGTGLALEHANGIVIRCGHIDVAGIGHQGHGTGQAIKFGQAVILGDGQIGHAGNLVGILILGGTGLGAQAIAATAVSRSPVDAGDVDQRHGQITGHPRRHPEHDFPIGGDVHRHRLQKAGSAGRTPGIGLALELHDGLIQGAGDIDQIQLRIQHQAGSSAQAGNPGTLIDPRPQVFRHAGTIEREPGKRIAGLRSDIDVVPIGADHDPARFVQTLRALFALAQRSHQAEVAGAGIAGQRDQAVGLGCHQIQDIVVDGKDTRGHPLQIHTQGRTGEAGNVGQLPGAGITVELGDAGATARQGINLISARADDEILDIRQPPDIADIVDPTADMAQFLGVTIEAEPGHGVVIGTGNVHMLDIRAGRHRHYMQGLVEAGDGGIPGDCQRRDDQVLRAAAAQTEHHETVRLATGHEQQPAILADADRAGTLQGQTRTINHPRRSVVRQVAGHGIALEERQAIVINAGADEEITPHLIPGTHRIARNQGQRTDPAQAGDPGFALTIVSEEFEHARAGGRAGPLDGVDIKR